MAESRGQSSEGKARRETAEAGRIEDPAHFPLPFAFWTLQTSSQASTSPIGSVSGSVSGTGREPTR